jgi:O-antigen/teichoic acid export membrane protein
LVLVASFVACFLAPWSEELVAVLLGESYLPGWPVLFLMLFYPIHQTMGQINSTIFMSAGLTSSYMKITVSGLLASIPVSCLLLAPESDGWLSGLGLGALGLAIKMVGMNILFVNIQSWIISSHYKIDFDWRSQISAPITLLLLAFAAYLLPQAFVTATLEFSAGIDKLVIMKKMLFAAFFYSLGVLAVILWCPAMIGLDRLTVETFYTRTRALLKN